MRNVTKPEKIGKGKEWKYQLSKINSEHKIKEGTKFNVIIQLN